MKSEQDFRAEKTFGILQEYHTAWCVLRSEQSNTEFELDVPTRVIYAEDLG